MVEVLSPFTKRKDGIIKLSKYISAGVREYWIVDPDKKQVAVYDFQKEDYPVIYGFGGEIPIGIFDGECRIDFAEIYEYMLFLYEKEEGNQ